MSAGQEGAATDEPWPAGIHEAVCGDCGETFNPAGPEDLIHVYREDGVTACGARGEYRGTWQTPDMGPGWLERTRRRRRPVGALRPEALADVVWCARHRRLEASIVIPPRCDEDGASEREVYRFVRGEPERRCPDCGEPGESVGHQECQYPGRVSDPDSRDR